MGKGMRAGKRKTKMGGGDMQKQLKQMQAMQREMEQSQAELAEREFTSTAGGGAVEVVINGNKEITKLNGENFFIFNFTCFLIASGKCKAVVIVKKR